MAESTANAVKPPVSALVFSVGHLRCQVSRYAGYMEAAALALRLLLAGHVVPLPRPCMVSPPVKLEESLARNLFSLEYWSKQAD